jgi:hypothetical protein
MRTVTWHEHAVVLLDPAAGGELSDDGLVEVTSGAEFDALNARLTEAQLSFLESAPDALRFACDPLSFDEQREALVEGHGLDVGVTLLLVPMRKISTVEAVARSQSSTSSVRRPCGAE